MEPCYCDPGEESRFTAGQFSLESAGCWMVVVIDLIWLFVNPTWSGPVLSEGECPLDLNPIAIHCYGWDRCAHSIY